MIMMTPPRTPDFEQKADAFMHAVHLMDELVEANDGDADRAIGLMMLAVAVKAGDPGVALMRRVLDELGRESIEAGQALFLKGYRAETRQQRRNRQRRNWRP